MVASNIRKAQDLPQVIPVFPLEGVLLLPHGKLPLNIFEPRYLITLTGLSRFLLGEELPVRTPYRQVRADFMPFEGDLRPIGEDEGFDKLRLLHALKAYLDRRLLEVDWETAKAAPSEALVNSLAMALPFEPAEKQALLEAPTTWERREALVALLEIDAASSGDDDEIHSVQ